MYIHYVYKIQEPLVNTVRRAVLYLVYCQGAMQCEHVIGAFTVPAV